MAFKSLSSKEQAPESPQALFQDLKTKQVPGLLVHQGEILQHYMGALDKPDVALHLPTGSGKTLVGLLLAEWRRRTRGERVVYLCPTRQLVTQVAAAAHGKYGLRVSAFLGSKHEYAPAAKTAYLDADAVAVTAYSSLFNIRPFFENPHVLVLDDAHAADNYISSNWALSIQKSEHPALFAALAHTFGPTLSALDRESLIGQDDSPWAQQRVDKLPTPALFQLASAITAILDTHCVDGDLHYRWGNLRSHLLSCHVYFSANSILIRPLTPPTSTHAPFAGARQRVYMSATLGHGGDLERITGRRSIHRLPSPSSYVKRGVGRRFFMFPERSLAPEGCTQLVTELVKRTPRTLWLVPSMTRAAEVTSHVQDTLQYPVFTGASLEEAKDAFVAAPHAVCVAAGRYDGIDLAGDECRLLIVDNISTATSLQERFFVQRTAARALLSDRIQTRIVQAFGRCTRGDTDYAAVVVLGDDVDRYVGSPEERRHFHPELQAELAFGIAQSKTQTLSGFVENLQHFLNQSSAWEQASSEILKLRDDATQASREALKDLEKSVIDEVQYGVAMWNGDYLAALASARSVLGHLVHADLRGYRALWNYLAGSAAFLHSSLDAKHAEVARQFFHAAATAAPSLSWLHKIALAPDPEDEPLAVEPHAAIVIDRFEQGLTDLGMQHDRRFAAEEQFLLENLRYTRPTDETPEEERERLSSLFEQAHARLGSLLGYLGGTSSVKAAPDAWWIVDSQFAFVFEDHSSAGEQAQVDVTKARQAASHPMWLRANPPGSALDPDATIVTVLITPARRAEDEAMAFLSAVPCWPVEDFCKWAKNVLGVVRSLRSSFVAGGDIAWRQQAHAELAAAHATPSALREHLVGMTADKLFATKS